MYRRDYRDIIGGLILIVLGLATSLHAYLQYPLGSLRHLGSGMFPASLGVILAGLGLLIIIPAIFRSGPPLPRFEVRPFLAVIGGGLATAYVIPRFGMVPAVVVMSVFATLADDKLGVVATLMLATFLAVLTLAIFSYGLSIPLQPFRWPF